MERLHNFLTFGLSEQTTFTHVLTDKFCPYLNLTLTSMTILGRGRETPRASSSLPVTDASSSLLVAVMSSPRPSSFPRVAAPVVSFTTLSKN